MTRDEKAADVLEALRFLRRQDLGDAGIGMEEGVDEVGADHADRHADLCS